MMAGQSSHRAKGVRAIVHTTHEPILSLGSGPSRVRESDGRAFQLPSHYDYGRDDHCDYHEDERPAAAGSLTARVLV